MRGRPNTTGRCETWLPATSASAGAARSSAHKAAAEAGLDGERAWDLMVATTEAVNNAVQHGRPWPNRCVLFVTERCPRGLRVEVSDLGTFSSALEPAPLEATSGRGMQIIAAVVDRLEVRKEDGATVLRFEKHRGRRRPREVRGPSMRGMASTVSPPPTRQFAPPPEAQATARLAADAGGAGNVRKGLPVDGRECLRSLETGSKNGTPGNAR
jgi:anti-sigma regulatory factor (Ser/Thr protein kinase)